MRAMHTEAKETYTLRLGASEVVVMEEVDDEVYVAETLPLSPEAGQDVGNCKRQLDASQSLEESAS